MEGFMKPVLAAVIAALVASPVLASSHGHQHKQPPAQAVPSASSAVSEGEVRRVDKEAKKLTIRHGPLANLDMPAMTMVFEARDAAELERLKAGDKIRFVAEKIGDRFVASSIEPIR
jgi:Cu(I)/Ag(I) efflux system periplasmic protein CusF